VTDEQLDAIRARLDDATFIAFARADVAALLDFISQLQEYLRLSLTKRCQHCNKTERVFPLLFPDGFRTEGCNSCSEILLRLHDVENAQADIAARLDEVRRRREHDAEPLAGQNKPTAT